MNVFSRRVSGKGVFFLENKNTDFNESIYFAT